jgi:hypothetical protein
MLDHLEKRPTEGNGAKQPKDSQTTMYPDMQKWQHEADRLDENIHHCNRDKEDFQQKTEAFEEMVVQLKLLWARAGEIRLFQCWEDLLVEIQSM